MRESGGKTISRAGSTLHEKHYTCKELAKILHLSEGYVRRLFQDEPGVFKLESPLKRKKRRSYVTLRIPESVVERVLAKYSIPWNG